MIETHRLKIRKVLPEDWRDLYEYLSLKEIYTFEPGSPICIAEAKRMVVERTCGNSFFSVIEKASKKMIGHLYFSHIHPLEFLTWELGFIFNPLYQNQGYCTEASRAMIEYAFDSWHAHRIVAYCNPQNIPSWRVLEKAGMKREGFFEQKAFFNRDEENQPIWHDCYAYGILRKQWCGKG